jgi:alanine dehydrogenase
VRVLTSADLERLGRRGAFDAVRRFLRASADGRTASPPRLTVPLDGRTLVFTVGADLDDDVAGFRVYSTGGSGAPAVGPTQLVVALRHATGEILAVGAAEEFGVWRTAALGTVAMTECTRSLGRPLRMAVVGTGLQAFHQARAWIDAAPVAEVRVWSRRPEAVATFAAALDEETSVPTYAAHSVEACLSRADAVLCATSSPAPVFDDDALPRDVFVATLGPKFGGAHELPAATFARAGFLVTDAPAQIADYERARGPLPGGRAAAECVALGEVVAGRAAAPASGLRLFVSEGLAGSEVALLAAVLRT